MFLSGVIFAGCCTWREIADEDKLIQCSKFVGKVEYGILKERREHEKVHKIIIDGKEIEESVIRKGTVKNGLLNHYSAQEMSIDSWPLVF